MAGMFMFEITIFALSGIIIMLGLVIAHTERVIITKVAKEKMPFVTGGQLIFLISCIVAFLLVFFMEHQLYAMRQSMW